MENKKIESKILNDLNKAKSELKNKSYDEQWDSYEEFIKKNNCKVKTEEESNE